LCPSSSNGAKRRRSLGFQHLTVGARNRRTHFTSLQAAGRRAHPIQDGGDGLPFCQLPVAILSVWFRRNVPGRTSWSALGSITSSSCPKDSVAEAAAQHKECKYTDIAQTDLFYPPAFETTGPINQAGQDFISDLGHRISVVTDATSAILSSSNASTPSVSQTLSLTITLTKPPNRGTLRYNFFFLFNF
jgi:hypothetical protein